MDRDCENCEYYTQVDGQEFRACSQWSCEKEREETERENIKNGDVTFYDGFVYILYREGEIEDRNEKLASLMLDPEYGPVYSISLREILEKYPGVFMVIHDDWQHSPVFRYGNCGPFWEKIGEVRGFA